MRYAMPDCDDWHRAVPRGAWVMLAAAFALLAQGDDLAASAAFFAVGRLT